jgi:hypothetical protein
MFFVELTLLCWIWISATAAVTSKGTRKKSCPVCGTAPRREREERRGGGGEEGSKESGQEGEPNGMKRERGRRTKTRREKREEGIATNENDSW